MRVAVYGRKSQENEENVKVQVDNARAFALSRGWSVVDANIFTDDGISGAEFNDRPGFTALTMAAKAKKRPFDAIVTMNVDRLGREAFRTNIALLEIAEAGVRIYTYADGQEVKLDSPISKQMLSMRNYAAEDFRQQIADKTREKLIAKAKLGHATGARTYGYDLVRVDKHVERRINADEAAIVQRVFAMASEGYGNIRIVNALAGCPAPGKKGWSKSVVNTMLANALYRGVIVYGKTKSAARGGAAERRTKAEPAVILPMESLRIVSDTLWTTVQTRKQAIKAQYHRDERGRLLGKPESAVMATHLLNGIARCGLCDGALSFQSKNGRTRRYYCSTRLTHGEAGCKNSHGVPAAALDTEVLYQLHEMLSGENMFELFKERAERHRREHESKSGERRNAEKAIARLEAEIARLVGALAAGTGSADITAAITERRSKVENLKAQLVEPEVLDLDKDTVVDKIKRWVGSLINRHDPVTTRQVLRKLGVTRIVVSPDPSGGWRFDGGADLTGLISDGKVSNRSAVERHDAHQHSAGTSRRYSMT